MFADSLSNSTLSAYPDDSRDGMVVCTNGHVLTDRLRDHPELQGGHCEQCGAATLTRCPTCGMGLPGAGPASGLTTVGQRPAPSHCAACGADFPWVRKMALPPGDLLPALEKLLRRLPRTVRELKRQAGPRPPFRLDDERDLEYLLRAVLPLCCDDVRLHGRTPGYSPFSRTDFLLMPDRIAVTAKLVHAASDADRFHEQLREDAAYYGRQKECRLLVAFVLDVQGLLHEPEQLEALWAGTQGVNIRCMLTR